MRYTHGNLHFVDNQTTVFSKRGKYTLVFRNLDAAYQVLLPQQWEAMQKDLQEVIDVYVAAGRQESRERTLAWLRSAPEREQKRKAEEKERRRKAYERRNLPWYRGGTHARRAR